MNDQKQKDLVQLAFNFLIIRDGFTTTLDVKNFLHHNNFAIKQKDVSELVNNLFNSTDSLLSDLGNLRRVLEYKDGSNFYRYFAEYKQLEDDEDDINQEDYILVNSDEEENEDKDDTKYSTINFYKTDLSNLTSDQIEDLALDSEDWVCRFRNNFDNQVYVYKSSLKEYQARSRYVSDTGYHKDNVRRMRLSNFLKRKKAIEQNYLSLQ